MSIDLGLLVIRLVVGLAVAAHGAQKLFGWFGGFGLQPTAGFMGTMGLRPGALWALLAGISELGGGLLVALGFLNPVGAIGVVAAMATAIRLVHWPRFWNGDNGMELPLVNASVALGIAVVGPGAYSLDSAAGIALNQPLILTTGLAAAAAVVTVASAMAAAARKLQPAAPADASAQPAA